MDNTALLGDSYSLAQDLPLFGVEVSEGNSCQCLSEETWANQDSYAGFDFEKIWKVTNRGARLIAQADESPEEEKTEEENVKEDDSGKNEILEKEKTKKICQKEKTIGLEEGLDRNGNIKNTVTLSADDLIYEDFTYIISGEKVTITGYAGNGGSVILPDEIDGCMVTEIGNSAFSECIKVKGIEFPESLERIGSYAFYKSGLESLEIPASIKEVGSYAFRDCERLSSVSFAENHSNGHTASIRVGAFYNDGALSEVRLSPNVERMEDSCFYDCRSLEELSLPRRLRSIGSNAFHGTYIGSITVPKSVESCGVSYGSGPFAGMPHLKEVIFEEGIRKIPDYICSMSSNIEKVTIPEGTEEIGREAFHSCSSLEKVVLPESISKINYYSFADNTNLKNIEVTSKDISVDLNAFYNSTAILVSTLRTSPMAAYCVENGIDFVILNSEEPDTGNNGILERKDSSYEFLTNSIINSTATVVLKCFCDKWRDKNCSKWKEFIRRVFSRGCCRSV